VSADDPSYSLHQIPPLTSPTNEEELMTDLSPAAQAIMVAATNGNFNVVNDPVYKQCIAAALRAVAEQVFPINYVIIDNCQYEAPSPEREQIFAIAAELEAQ
jgi:hypothetical protein